MSDLAQWLLEAMRAVATAVTGVLSVTPLEMWIRETVQVLTNGIWQALLLTLAVWLFLRLARRINAATRHAIWFGALLTVMALPLVTGRFVIAPEADVQPADVTTATERRETSAGTTTASVVQKPLTVAHRAQLLEAGAALLKRTEPTVLADSRSEPTPPPVASRKPLPAAFQSLPTEVRLPGGTWTQIAFLIWFAVAAVGLVRLGAAVSRIRRLKRLCRPLPAPLALRLSGTLRMVRANRGACVCVTDELGTPAVLGLGRPRIVIPSNLLAHLSDRELKQVIWHELAHVRRRDDWTQLVSRLAEILLFFNPAVRLISRHLTLEREIACDDSVLLRSDEPRDYATCLSKLFEFRLNPSRALPAPGAILTRKQIFRRVDMLLNRNRNISARTSRLGLLAGALILVAILALATFVSPVIAVEPASRRPAPPAEPAPPAVPTVPETPAPSAEPAYPAAPAPPAPAAATPLLDGTTLPEGAAPEAAAVPSVPAVPSVQSVPSVPSVPSVAAVPSAPVAPRWAQSDPLAESEERLKDAEKRVQESEERLRESENFQGTMQIHGDDGEVTYVWNRGRYRLRVEMDGKVKFAPDGSDVASISRDGFFLIAERDGSQSRELEIMPGRNGELEYYYTENRREREFDAGARRWLAETLQEIMLQTGMGAAERVRAIRTDRGVDGVLREISQVESDYVKRIYFEELVKSGPLNPEEARRMFRQVDREMDSDYERAELLIEYVDYAENDLETRDVFVQAVAGIDSDYETRRVLTALGTKDNLDDRYARAVFEICTQMDSDYEKAELLVELADYSRNRENLRDLYVQAVADIDSDYEKRRVLSELALPDDVDEAFVDQLLQIAQTIDSDYEKAELLVELGDYAVMEDGLLRSYLRVAEDIDSDYEKRRVLSALALHAGVSDDALLDLLRIAEGIDSDYEKAEFLVEYGEFFTRTAELEDATERVADTIDSDYERDRVYSSLWKRHRKSRSTQETY